MNGGYFQGPSDGILQASQKLKEHGGENQMEVSIKT
jgi:hypothetical protein